VGILSGAALHADSLAACLTGPPAARLSCKNAFLGQSGLMNPLKDAFKTVFVFME